MTKKRKVVRLDKLRTARHVAARMGVTEMTLWNWRQDLGLPVVEIPGDQRPAIRFHIDDVKKWAEQHGKAISSH